MGAIQSRFEVAVPELPDHIDPASYSKSCSSSLPEHGRYGLTRDECSDVMRLLLYFVTYPRCLRFVYLSDKTV